MAKYLAKPFYAVKHEAGEIKFDFKGVYETEKKKEQEILDGLCPMWLKKVEESKQPEAQSKPKPKASAK